MATQRSELSGGCLNQLRCQETHNSRRKRPGDEWDWFGTMNEINKIALLCPSTSLAQAIAVMYLFGFIHSLKE